MPYPRIMTGSKEGPDLESSDSLLILPDPFAQTDFRLFCLHYKLLSWG